MHWQLSIERTSVSASWHAWWMLPSGAGGLTTRVTQKCAGCGSIAAGGSFGGLWGLLGVLGVVGVPGKGVMVTGTHTRATPSAVRVSRAGTAGAASRLLPSVPAADSRVSIGWWANSVDADGTADCIAGHKTELHTGQLLCGSILA